MIAVLSAVLLTRSADAGRRRAPDLDGVAAELFGRALASDEAWAELTTLSDDIGHRISGSPELERAIAWAAQEMREDGLRVALEPVQVNHWVRGPPARRGGASSAGAPRHPHPRRQRGHP